MAVFEIHTSSHPLILSVAAVKAMRFGWFSPIKSPKRECPKTFAGSSRIYDATTVVRGMTRKRQGITEKRSTHVIHGEYYIFIESTTLPWSMHSNVLPCL